MEKRRSALNQPNAKTYAPVMTPVEQERGAKQRATAVTKASATRKRKQAVEAASANNGSGALSAELQDQRAEQEDLEEDEDPYEPEGTMGQPLSAALDATGNR